MLLVASQTQASAWTREYMPVCGRLKGKPQTFPNLCMLKKAGATLLYEGECKPKPKSLIKPAKLRAELWLPIG